MTAGSWYRSFAELNKSEREGESYRLFMRRRKSGIAIVAPHGGGIEPGTSEIARAVAGLIFSLYIFDAIKPNGNDILHITSTLFDEPECLKLAGRSQVLVAVHGCEGKEMVVHVGGLHHALKDRIMAELQNAGFDARQAESQFQGSQPQNICNRGTLGMGVQLEISEGLRRAMFRGLKRQERETTTIVFKQFTGAIRKALVKATRDLQFVKGFWFYLF